VPYRDQDARRACERRSYRKHRDAKLARTRAYWEANKEKYREWNRAWQQDPTNSDSIRATKKRFYARHKDAVSQKHREWLADPENLELKRAITRRHGRRGWAPGEHERAEASRQAVSRCACCGSASPRRKTGWVADHNHETGKFRAHICHPCNIRIGYSEKYGLELSPAESVYLALHDGQAN
jgi:hypothetical protein